MKKLLAPLLLLIPYFANAQDAYISPSGSNSNDCRTVATPCLTIQYAVDKVAPGLSGGANVHVANGTYTAGLNALYYKFINVTGNCSGPSQVVFSTPAAAAFQAQDHVILTLNCLTITGAGGYGITSRQFAIVDYDKIRFDSMTIHVMASEHSKINCTSETIIGGAVYHWSAGSQSQIVGNCAVKISPGLSFSAFAYAVQLSLINASSATFTNGASGYQYINDSSVIERPAAGFPGSGGVCQNGCVMK